MKPTLDKDTTIDDVLHYARSLMLEFSGHKTRESAMADLIDWYSNSALNTPVKSAPIEHMFVDLKVMVEALLHLAEKLDQTKLN